MAIDPRSMRVFLAVCRAGSISGAARDLNISQPSVSVVIAQLERGLDTQLFSRTRSGIMLSATGTALRRRAEAMEALLVAAEREVSLVAQQASGPLVIGGTPGALASLLPAAIVHLRHTDPRFQIQVLERNDQQLIELLRNQRIELALVTTGIEGLPEDVVEEPILRDPFDLIVGAANAHLPPRMRLNELQDMPWVLPDAVGAFRRQLDALFIAADTPAPINAIRCDSLIATKALVRRTDYVTILPRQVAAAELSMGVLRAITLEDVQIHRTIGVRRLAGAEPSALAGRFLKALRDERLYNSTL